MGCQREKRTEQNDAVAANFKPYKRRHQLGATFREDGTTTADTTEMGEIIATHWEKEFELKHIDLTVAREWASKHVRKFLGELIEPLSIDLISKALGKGGWKARALMASL